MLKLGKINREKKCKIIQKSTWKKQSTFIKWGGAVPSGTLSSGATLLNREDYNTKEYGGTLTCYSLFIYNGGGYGYGRK